MVLWAKDFLITGMRSPVGGGCVFAVGSVSARRWNSASKCATCKTRRDQNSTMVLIELDIIRKRKWATLQPNLADLSISLSLDTSLVLWRLSLPRETWTFSADYEYNFDTCQQCLDGVTGATFHSLLGVCCLSAWKSDFPLWFNTFC